MIVICKECGLKYKIDPAKMKSKRARFACKGCGEFVLLDKEEMEQSSEIAALEESLFSSISDEDEARESDQESSAEVIQSIPKKKSGLGLASKVVFLMLLVSLLPGAVYFALSFKQTNQRITNDTKNYGLQISAILANEVDEWVVV